ncbi:Exosome complex exonuclease RRP46 -like protein [Capsicum annuum]|nr:Exosome complex exonuclease RRP46 -like protein [Capsicum annuum]
MEVGRQDGRTANQLRPLTCTRNVLNRAHGSASWSQGETKVLAAVYGPKAGTKKNENPEKACFEVIWKPKTGHVVFDIFIHKLFGIAVLCCIISLTIVALVLETSLAFEFYDRIALEVSPIL